MRSIEELKALIINLENTIKLYHAHGVPVKSQEFQDLLNLYKDYIEVLKLREEEQKKDN